jgi:hypothetical protein
VAGESHPRDEAIERHEKLRAESPYQEQLKRQDSLTYGFINALRVCWVASTRDPASARWLFWRFVDDLLASALAIALLAREGIDLPARRELRFMLEIVIRNLYVDTVFASRETPLETRLAYVEHRLEQKDLELLAELKWNLVDDAERFEAVTKRLYGELSTYTHPSHEQMARRLEQAERGVYLGFETSLELASFNDLLERTYDVILVYVFEALGPSSTGDVFINLIDELPNWPFAATAFVPAISASYDYKDERQTQKDG